MMSIRRRLAARATSPVICASVRLNSSGTSTQPPPPPPTNEAGAKPQSTYDREAELKREEAARAQLYQGGFPSPFKMFQEMQRQQGQGGNSQQPGGAAGPRPGIVQEAWQEAMKETSKRFFGKDASSAPPQDFKQWMGQAAETAQQVRNRMMSGATGQPSASGAPTGDVSASNGSPSTPPPPPPPSTPQFPGFPGFGNASSNAGQGPRVGRLMAGIIIVWCSFWMMRRSGIFGDFRHVQVPFWCVGYEDTAKWLLYTFTFDDKRRGELQQQYLAMRPMNPSLNFFDFVDSVQPDWRSSPTNSKESVLAAVSSLVRTDSSFRAIGVVKAGLESGSGMFGGFFGGDTAGLSPYQQRVDALMRILPAEHKSSLHTLQTPPVGGHYGWTPAHQPPAFANHFRPYGLQPAGPQPGYSAPTPAQPAQQWPPAQHGAGQTYAPYQSQPVQPLPQQAVPAQQTLTPQQQQAYWAYMQQQQQLWMQLQQQQQQGSAPLQHSQVTPSASPVTEQQTIAAFSSTPPPVENSDLLTSPAVLPSPDAPVVEVLEHSFKTDLLVTPPTSSTSDAPKSAA